MRRKTYRGVSYDPQNPEAFIEEVFRKEDIYSIDRENKKLFDSGIFSNIFESFGFTFFLSYPFLCILISSLDIKPLLISSAVICGIIFSYGFIDLLKTKKRDKIQNALLQEHFDEVMEFLEEKERDLKSRMEIKINKEKILEKQREELKKLKKENREFKIEKNNKKTLSSYS